MTPPRKVPHPETVSLSKWRCFLSKCHWGGAIVPGDTTPNSNPTPVIATAGAARERPPILRKFQSMSTVNPH